MKLHFHKSDKNLLENKSKYTFNAKEMLSTKLSYQTAKPPT